MSPSTGRRPWPTIGAGAAAAARAGCRAGWLTPGQDAGCGGLVWVSGVRLARR